MWLQAIIPSCQILDLNLNHVGGIPCMVGLYATDRKQDDELQCQFKGILVVFGVGGTWASWHQELVTLGVVNYNIYH